MPHREESPGGSRGWLQKSLLRHLYSWRWLTAQKRKRQIVTWIHFVLERALAFSVITYMADCFMWKEFPHAVKLEQNNLLLPWGWWRNLAPSKAWSFWIRKILYWLDWWPENPSMIASIVKTLNPTSTPRITLLCLLLNGLWPWSNLIIPWTFIWVSELGCHHGEGLEVPYGYEKVG